jgi:cytochrome c-type biogenesis protein
MLEALAFAFAAGALSTVNPCGFALLPAFLAYYMGQETDAAPGSLAVRLYRGVSAGAALTAGYAGVFTVAGLLLAVGLRFLIGVVPWLAVAIGAGLAALGVALLAGRTVGLRLNANKLVRRRGGVRGVVIFGAAYAVASLSCTLAVLLAVIAQALAAADVAAVIGVFAAYATGAASVLVLLAVSAALASGALARVVRRALPYVSRVSGAVLVVSGGYLVAYWVPQLAGQRSGTALSRGGATVAGTFTQWLEGRIGLVAVAAVLALVGVAALVAASAQRERRGAARQPGAEEAGDCCDSPVVATTCGQRTSQVDEGYSRQADR